MTNEHAIAILREMQPTIAHCDKDARRQIAIRMAIEALSERKTGKWIKHENPKLGKCMRVFWECSVCKTSLGCEYFVRRSYCPNCGAKMEGADE